MHQITGILDFICFIETFVWSILLFMRRKDSRSFVFAGQFFLGVSLIFLFFGANHLHCLFLSMVLNFLIPFILPSVLITSLFYLHGVFKSKPGFPAWLLMFLILPALLFAIYNHAFYFHYPLKEVVEHFYDLLETGSHSETFKLISNARRLLFWVMVFGLAVVIIIQVAWITTMVRRQTANFSLKRQQILLRLIRVLLILIILEVAGMIYLNFPDWHLLTRVFWIPLFFLLGWNMFYSVPKKNRVKRDLKQYVDKQLKITLLEYFEKSKPWLNPDLKIEEVIQYLGTNRTYFWKLLHEDLDISFKDFVNRYRMKEVLRLLDQRKKMTIFELMEQTGFKSYSTFFKIFFKELGIAPGEYLKKHGDLQFPRLPRTKRKF